MLSYNEITVNSDETAASFWVYSNTNSEWSLTPGSGVTVNPTSGVGHGQIVATFPANTSTTNENTYTVTASLIAQEGFAPSPQTFTITQRKKNREPSNQSTNYSGNLTLNYNTTTTNDYKYVTPSGGVPGAAVIINGTTYSGLRIGATQGDGWAKITIPAGTTYLHIHVACYKGKSFTLNISSASGFSQDLALTSNSGISDANGNTMPYTLNGTLSSSDYYKVLTFNPALTENTELTFMGRRYVLWGVYAEE